MYEKIYEFIIQSRSSDWCDIRHRHVRDEKKLEFSAAAGYTQRRSSLSTYRACDMKLLRIIDFNVDLKTSTAKANPIIIISSSIYSRKQQRALLKSIPACICVAAKARPNELHSGCWKMQLHCTKGVLPTRTDESFQLAHISKHLRFLFDYCRKTRGERKFRNINKENNRFAIFNIQARNGAIDCVCLCDCSPANER